jgi:hypothetical protein
MDDFACLQPCSDSFRLLSETLVRSACLHQFGDSWPLDGVDILCIAKSVVSPPPSPSGTLPLVSARRRPVPADADTPAQLSPDHIQDRLSLPPVRGSVHVQPRRAHVMASPSLPATELRRKPPLAPSMRIVLSTNLPAVINAPESAASEPVDFTRGLKGLLRPPEYEPAPSGTALRSARLPALGSAQYSEFDVGTHVGGRTRTGRSTRRTTNN